MKASDLFLSAAAPQQSVERFLARQGFQKPRQADLRLQEVALRVNHNPLLADLAETLLNRLSGSVDPDMGVLGLSRFFEAAPNPTNLLHFLRSDPAALKVLVGILAGSPFLAQTLIRKPEYLYWLTQPDRYQRIEHPAYFVEQAQESVQPFMENPRLALDALRRMKRREDLRIGTQDLLNLVSVDQTIGQLSHLADAVIAKVLEILAQSESINRQEFCVLAVGKLGGRELNFSSDVDLIYLCEEGQETSHMIRLARKLSGALAESTSEGRLYRVDLRLRPMGRSGEIVYSEAALRHYYSNWGDTSDRLALLKARFCAGNQELAKKFLDFSSDFIFRRYLDQAAVEEISWIKHKIDRGLHPGQTDIKLGPGGIREIEFFVQSFQILYGGRYPELKTTNTLQALERLSDTALVNKDDCQKLAAAYRFFRRVEHLLQLVQDFQTHTLPGEEREMEKLARSFHCFAPDRKAAQTSFGRELQEHQEFVHFCFQMLFPEEKKTTDVRRIVLEPALAESQAEELLLKAGVREASSFLQGLRLLEQAPAYPHSPTRIRNLLANLLPAMLLHARHLSDPKVFFTRLDRLLEAFGSRAGIYRELAENEGFADQLFSLLSASEKLAETLITHPELLEAVAAPPFTLAPTTDENLNTFLQIHHKLDESEAARLFRIHEEFKAGVERSLHQGVWDSVNRLTCLADTCVAFALKAVKRKVDWLDPEEYSLWALGSLAAGEITFGSDLDLVFFFDDSRSTSSPSEWHQVVRSFQNEISHYRRFGRLFNVDFRLRPEGSRGAAAYPFSAAQSFFHEKMDAWQRLAYARTRCLAGAQQPVWAWMQQTVFKQGFKESELQQIHHLRLRKERELTPESQPSTFHPKLGKGGLADLHFVLQKYQVIFQIYDPKTRSIINKIKDKFPESQVKQLRLNYEFLLGLETALQLAAGQGQESFSPSDPWLPQVAYLMQMEHSEQLLEAYLECREWNRALFNREFGA